MEQALGNHVIVSNILSFISPKNIFLDCRLINKFWNEQVLTKYFKRGKIFFNLQKYLTQRKRNWHISSNCQLSKRIFLQGSIPLRGILNFFHRHKNVETIRMENTQQRRFFDLRISVFEMFQKELCPNLTCLIFDEYSRVEEFITPKTINGNANITLCNLKILIVSHLKTQETFSVFGQAVLDISPNLEVLRINSTKSLPRLQPGIKLKELMITSNEFIQMVPEFEQLLQQLSSNLETLIIGEEFRAITFMETDYNFPIMPKLRTYSALGLTLNPFPLGGDLISFINKKMPALETLRIGDFWDHRLHGIAAQHYNFAHSIIRSTQENNVLKSLSIPAPKEVKLIHEIKRKFTALKEIDVSAYIRTSGVWHIDDNSFEDVVEISELAFALAMSRVKSSTIHIYSSMNVDILEEKVMEAVKMYLTFCQVALGIPKAPFRNFEKVFFPKSRNEECVNVRIKTEKFWYQLHSFGFK